jgi:putative ABC transport system ATP-binding protein
MIDVCDVTRTYGSGSTATAALRGVTFTVGEGKLVALRGRSGSGKTTLLNKAGTGPLSMPPFRGSVA